MLWKLSINICFGSNLLKKFALYVEYLKSHKIRSNSFNNKKGLKWYWFF